MSGHSIFQTEVTRLLTQREIPDALYFTISLLADAEGNWQWGVQTQWCGFTESKPRRDIREGALFRGEAQRDFYSKLGEPALLINTAHDLDIWRAFGGHGILIEPLGKEYFPELISPRESARDWGGLGFRETKDASSSQLQHAPSKKLRMEVLNRDGRRCRICGRSPATNVDVELHVHHAVPWGAGGLTEIENLITLCKTCHDGLSPHFDYPLATSLRKHYPKPKPKYLDDLAKYQQWMRSRQA